jgi:hypothetical protein
MRQSPMLLAALAASLLSACGPATLVVVAENEVQDPISGTSTVRPLSNLEVLILPYDRDAVFDSLEAAASMPEPEIPADVLEAQNRIAEAQRAWLDTENRWNVLRDTLQKLNTAMDQYSRAEAQYRLLFADYQALEAQYNRIENQVTQAFNSYESLRQASEARAQEVKLARDEWADEAFADAGVVFREKIRASGLDAKADTTDAQGIATADVKPGQYWIYARYPLTFTELYWNVPVTVAKGEPTQIQLTRANAQERPRL